MMTNSVKRAQLEVEVALKALYPIIHIVTDDYSKVEQIMERSYFERHQWEPSALAYTKGQASSEYIRLLPVMSQTDLMCLVTGAGAPPEVISGLNTIEEMTRRALCLCQDELPLDSPHENALDRLAREIQALQQKVQALSDHCEPKKRVFYARGDSYRQDGTFSDKTATLIERYVELKLRAMNRFPQKGREIPEQWPESCMVLYGCDTVVPRSIEQYVYRVEIMPLDDQDFSGILANFGVQDADMVKWYADWLAGFSESEILAVLREIVAREGTGAARLVNSFARKIIEKKKQERVKKHSKLIYESVPANMTLPENMANIREWILEHAYNIRDNSSRDSDEITKGMLLVGVPGTGKSLVAKTVAAVLRLPLYRLKMSAVLGKYVGESDKNMDEVLEDVRNAAPLVLWMDEFEKEMAGADGSDGNGVMQRLFGQLLYFMQEMNKTVFIVATSNDMSKFPPELKRNGRFDVRFCTPMPDYADCVSIMNQKLNQFLGCGDDDQKLAHYLFDICCGMNTPNDGLPRFLTGADINAVVKELKVKLGNRRFDRKIASSEYERFGKAMLQASKAVNMTGETRNPQTIRDIAVCYRSMLNMSAMMAGKGSALISAERFRPRAITMSDLSKDDPCPTCMIRPDDYEGRPIYDRWLFDAVVSELDLLLAQELKNNDYEQYRKYMEKYRKAHSTAPHSSAPTACSC